MILTSIHTHKRSPRVSLAYNRPYARSVVESNILWSEESDVSGGVTHLPLYFVSGVRVLAVAGPFVVAVRGRRLGGLFHKHKGRGFAARGPPRGVRALANDRYIIK
jgi:hypothetical protein